MVDTELMHETMVDCFLELEEDSLDGKSTKEIILEWINWIDSRYKVAIVPGACYAIIDCEDGNMVSMFNADLPNAKEQAKEMCASLNEKEPNSYAGYPLPTDIAPQENKYESSDVMINADKVVAAFLEMDDDEFIDFLMNYTDEAKNKNEIGI